MFREPNNGRLPVVGEVCRGVGRLVEIQDVTPEPVPRVLDYIFEDQDWQPRLLINGVLVDTFSTYTVFGGAIEEAERLMVKLGLPDSPPHPETPIEVSIVRRTSRSRHRPLNRENFYHREFVDFEQLKVNCGVGMPDDVLEVVWRDGLLVEPPERIAVRYAERI